MAGGSLALALTLTLALTLALTLSLTLTLALTLKLNLPQPTARCRVSGARGGRAAGGARAAPAVWGCG